MLLVIVVSTWTLAFLFRLLFAFVALVDIFVVALLIAKTLLAAQTFVLVVVQTEVGQPCGNSDACE